MLFHASKKNKPEKTILKRRIRKGLIVLTMFSLIFLMFYAHHASRNRTEAIGGIIPIPCATCNILDVAAAGVIAEILRELFTDLIEENFDGHLNEHENWIVEEFFDDFAGPALAELSRFLGAYGIQQAQIAGAFFDAKTHLETQRLLFELHAEAHRDYHPSDDFCWFGTSAISLASSESRARLNALALSQRSLSRQLGTLGSAASVNDNSDKKTRWDQFVETYCDPNDNGRISNLTGLERACDRDGPGGSVAAGAEDIERVNRDIDYTRLIEMPRTLNVNFTDIDLPFNGSSPAIGGQNDPRVEQLNDEEDVLALSANLYGDDNLTQLVTIDQLRTSRAIRESYVDLRSVVAKRSVAEHSFNSIVAMKSAGTGGLLNFTGAQTGAHMAAIVRELMPPNTPDNEIVAILGENPSYYAQLEVLSKKIYQNPEFFANLYDKPANVERKSVAMKAIELMLDRALFESELRQEMILSVMLSSKLIELFKDVNSDAQREEDR